MLQSRILIYSVTVYLLVSNVNCLKLKRNIRLRNLENVDTNEIGIVPSKNSYAHTSDRDPQNVMKIMMDPIINAAAVPSDAEPSDILVLSDAVPPPLKNFVTNVLVSARFRALMFYFFRFVVCNLVSAPMACGLMNVLSDEVERGYVKTPEDVASGIRFIDDIIEIYHSAQKHTF